jgi:hypothetical protein
MVLGLIALVVLPVLAQEADWNDQNIVLDGTPSKWVKVVIDPDAPAPAPSFDDKWKR